MKITKERQATDEELKEFTEINGLYCPEDFVSDCCKSKMQEKDGAVYCKKCYTECESVAPITI